MAVHHLGIDLGTTNSAAALFDGERVTMVRNAQGGTLTPSVVRIDGRGSVSVGARARQRLDDDPANTRAEFKRLMGTGKRLEFAASGSSRLPEELAAEVLRSLRADVQDQIGILPLRAVVSVPALFEIPQASATAEAARLAGFERVELIQEPVASALAAGWSSADDAGAWLVYDLGGGTFDASLLETADGFLRVVGHDGDNFLGGRDVDAAVVDWAADEIARQHGVAIRRDEPRHAAALRRLKIAAEEAKVELTRAREATLAVGALDVDGRSLDVELVLPRGVLEALAAPLVARSIEVCRRLLAAHLGSRKLDRVVLVGGPTVMPSLRAAVAAALGVEAAAGIDPMTIVAQGAALYAVMANLPAAPPPAPRPVGWKLWLSHPAMSSDLSPHVVGRFSSDGTPPEPAAVRLVRADGGFTSPPVALDAARAFSIQVELVARRPNLFRIEALSTAATPVEVQPPTLTIVQGLTVSDPPLSRSVGVALASDRVQVYFERGAPLPARRTFLHHTVESVAKGSSGGALSIPIVQGEHERAHLCRLVGSLSIDGVELRTSLPAGSAVEVTVEVDRGGRLSARALVGSTGQVFEQVAHLLVPEASPEALQATIAGMQERIATLRRGAAAGDLAAVEMLHEEARRDVLAAQGGDEDAGQKARRNLLALDVLVEELELAARWPEVADDARHELAVATSWVSMHGTASEQQLLEESAVAVRAALAAGSAIDVQRQLRLVRRLCSAAYFRHPESWSNELELAASRVPEAAEQARAQALVDAGRAAVRKGDVDGVRSSVQALWALLPEDPLTRRLGHGSGVR